jgi:hypothetical protein
MYMFFYTLYSKLAKTQGTERVIIGLHIYLCVRASVYNINYACGCYVLNLFSPALLYATGFISFCLRMYLLPTVQQFESNGVHSFT